MKKFVILALTAAIAAACTLELVPQDEPVQPIEEASYVFTLNASAGDLTKSSYADEQTFSWSAGDQISVLFHKDTDNKFFTLTTASSGANVSFSGTIEAGYEIGASDDASKKYALFPAGDHSYTPGSLPVFNIPAVTDYSATHFSANIPMAANGDGDNNFAFTHMAGAYKITFTGIDPSVKKVRLVVTNQLDYKISGDFQLKTCYDAQHLFRWSQASTSKTDEKTLIYIENVAEGTATFYIPYSQDTYSEYSDFVPSFVLTNAANGYTLASVSAKSKAAFIGASYERKSDYNRIVVLPGIPASGTGTAPAWVSNHGINWDMVDNVVNGRSGSPYDGITRMKVTADAANLYVYLEINPSELETNASYAHANLASLLVGDGTETGKQFWGWSTYYQTRIRGWLMTDGAFSYADYDGGISIVDYASSEIGGVRYVEIAYPRTGVPALLNTSAYVAFYFDERYSTGGSPTGDDTPHGYAPNTEFTPRPSMMHVSLPTYSSAPASVSSPLNLTFTESAVDVLNPERGLYTQQSFHFRSGTIPSASLWDNPESLVLPLFYFEDFRTSDLSKAVTDRISDIFDNIRAAGKKAIVRFGYINARGEGDKPWDAGLSQIRRHIEQVTPILADNEDIIYVMQAGFVGVYGEWYYVSDDFNYDLNYATAVSNRSLVVGDLLDAVPHRQVGLRGAKYKRQYLSPAAENEWTAISSWGTSDNQRLGFFNDGFRGDANDIGTFESNNDRNMWYSQSAWVITGGETAYRGGDTPESKNEWLAANPAMASFDNAITAIQTQHFSYLNANSNNILMDYWDGAGGDVGTGESRIPELRKALGYRLVLNSADFTFDALTSGESVNYSISLQNKGSAPVIYSRPFKLVVIHNDAPTDLVTSLMDVRNLAPAASETMLSGSFTLPYSLSVGDKIAIWLPDADILDKGLDEIPAYSIRLANSDVTWDNGFNVLYTF